MLRWRNFGWFALLVLPAQSARAGEPKKLDFVHDIAPIIKARCAECHTNGKYKGSVSFDTREDLLKSKAIAPGKSAASEVIKRITHTGGVKRGFLYGETAPERPLVVTRNPVPIRDLHATILTAMGIAPRTSFDIERRPFYATEDGRGQAVDALFV